MHKLPIALLGAAALVAGCSSSGSDSAAPTVTVTQQQPAADAPSAAPSDSSAPSASSAAVGTAVTSGAASASGNKVIPVEALETLWVPELCGNPAGTLVDGSLPGAVGQSFLERRDDGTPMGAYTDINGDGKDEAVIAYYCDAGGVSWPDNLLIYDNDLNYLAQVERETWAFESPQGTVTPGRNGVRNLEWDDSSVTVRWIGLLPTDPECCATQVAESRLTMSGGRPVMELIDYGHA